MAEALIDKCPANLVIEIDETSPAFKYMNAPGRHGAITGSQGEFFCLALGRKVKYDVALNTLTGQYLALCRELTDGNCNYTATLASEG